MRLSLESHGLQQKSYLIPNRWKGWCGGVTGSDSHTACYFKHRLQGAGVTLFLEEAKTLEQEGKELWEEWAAQGGD